MEKYSYKGPVMMFGKCVTPNWTGETFAPSEKKARNNLAYQYKRQNGLSERASHIIFPNKLVKTEERIRYYG